MNADTKSRLFYVFLVFLLMPACLWISPVAPGTAAPGPIPGTTPAVATVAARAPTAGPTVVAGSFADFQVFAAELESALQDGNLTFFDRHLAPSVWNCLGEETQGVCKGMTAGTTLEGIPVSYDWLAYQVFSPENYKEVWQLYFDGGQTLKLAATANRFGDNPLMPMAGQSFLAIVAVAKAGDPAAVQEVRVLFFEHYAPTWHLAGELVTMKDVDAWLSGSCPTCYDTWTAWPE